GRCSVCIPAFGTWRTRARVIFFFIAPSPPGSYTLSLHDALPISIRLERQPVVQLGEYEVLLLQDHVELLAEDLLVEQVLNDEKIDRKSTRLNSSHVSTSYAVFCLKKKTRQAREVESTHHAARRPR